MLSNGDVKEFGETLQGENAVCATGLVEKIEGNIVTTTGIFIDCIDEDIGIEAIA